jgi:hypothetical protein
VRPGCEGRPLSGSSPLLTTCRHSLHSCSLGVIQLNRVAAVVTGPVLLFGRGSVHLAPAACTHIVPGHRIARAPAAPAAACWPVSNAPSRALNTCANL